MLIHLFGCKDTTLHITRALNKQGFEVSLITIPPDIALKNEVAGYLDLTLHKEEYKQIHTLQSYSIKDKRDIDFFYNHDFKLAFCIGWQRLIPSNVLKQFKLGVHGMHGSSRNLPFGKGRSPMNWSIIEGRKWFSTNLFKYKVGVDNGPIVDTITFSINNLDTAETLHFKNTLSMCAIIKKNIESLVTGKVIYKIQELEKHSTFYPKRNPLDGLIDWRDDVFNIDRLIRAVAPPFYGAIALKNKRELKIFRSSIFYTDIESHPFIKSLFGEVVDIFPNGKFLVRCSGGVILFHDFNGIDIELGDVLDECETPFLKFPRNIYGYFDN